MTDIAVEYLRDVLDVDPQNGVLTWKRRDRRFFTSNRACSTWNSRYAGKPALVGLSKGYRTGRIFDRCVKAHRVIWALYYGEWPKGDIDHINGNRADNRVSNLRLVDHQTNCKNQRLRSNNSSGITGVYWYARGRKWVAYINVDGSMKYLGRFDVLEEAVEARAAADEKYGFHQNHGSEVAA